MRCSETTQIATGDPNITGTIQCSKEAGHEGLHAALYSTPVGATTVEWADPWATA